MSQTDSEKQITLGLSHDGRNTTLKLLCVLLRAVKRKPLKHTSHPEMILNIIFNKVATSFTVEDDAISVPVSVTLQ